MGIFAREHELSAILAMRRRQSTRRSHGTPGQGNMTTQEKWRSQALPLVARVAPTFAKIVKNCFVHRATAKKSVVPPFSNRIVLRGIASAFGNIPSPPGRKVFENGGTTYFFYVARGTKQFSKILANVGTTSATGGNMVL